MNEVIYIVGLVVTLLVGFFVVVPRFGPGPEDVFAYSIALTACAIVWPAAFVAAVATGAWRLLWRLVDA